MTDSETLLRRRLEREIQARREAEALLEHKSEELYNSLFQLRSALESMAEGLLLTDLDHHVVLCNSQLRELYPASAKHLTRAKALGDALEDFQQHPDYQRFLVQDLGSVSFELELDDRVIAVEVRRTRNDQIASTHQDVTQQKAGEVERRQLLINLMRAQRLESIGRMSGMIAHDFNNIIAAIKGYIGFLDEDVEHSPQVDESLAALNAATEKAERLIQQILEYDSRQQFSRHAVSLVPVIEECLEMSEPRFRDRVEIAAELPETPIWIDGNETRLSQLVMNILSNADRAMQGNAHRLRVCVTEHIKLDLCEHLEGWDHSIAQSHTTHSGITQFDGPCVTIAITDSGSGMPQSVVDNMFEAYFSTRKSGRIGGVGLASVADILADHAGGIKVTTAPGQGTAIQLVLPTVNDPEDRVDRPSPKLRPKSIQVLVVDDDAAVGKMIKETLLREGIHADFLQSPIEAQYELLRDASRWQLVICDQIMPDLKGSELLQSLREAAINLPFVICSAHIDTVGAEITSELADRVLRKPVDRAALVACIEELVYPSVLR